LKIDKSIELPDLDASRASGAYVQHDLDEINRVNAWKLMPLLLLGYIFNWLDKANVGFASLEMNHQLGFSAEVFGFGAGLFFVTYTIFEIPSNLLLRRFGPRKWLARILITWGILSAAMALTSSKTSFYLFRLALGAAEAGWFPGVLLMLSWWFPPSYRARAMMLFTCGSPLAAIFGGPVSGMLLSVPTTLGLAGWQWLFVVEGIPSIILGFVVLRRLVDHPDQAPWLNRRQKEILAHATKSEQSAATAAQHASDTRFWRRQVPTYCVVNFLLGLSLYGIFIWLPHIVRSLGKLTNFQIGVVSALPFVFSLVALFLCASSSDRHKDRRWHVAAMFLLGAAGLAGASMSTSPLLTMGCLTIALMGMFGLTGTFFAMVTETANAAQAQGHSSAAGIATITAIGNLSGFAGPYIIGLLVSTFGNFQWALLGLSGLAIIASIAIAFNRALVVPREPANCPLG
jgi:MFS transporter, ACS family, tartrate transporter